MKSKHEGVKKMYVCRQCGHIGPANIKHWEMSEWRQGSDGSSYLHEWSGSTAYCKECNAIVKTKAGWAIDDYNEEFGARNFLLILLWKKSKSRYGRPY